MGGGPSATDFLYEFYRSRWGGIIQTALYAAAERENMSLDHFIRYGRFLVDPAALRPLDTWDFNGLHVEVLSGDVETVRRLLDDGADVCATFDTPFGEGPAVLLVLGEQPEDPQYTVKQWHVDLMKLFLDRGADVNASPCLKERALTSEEPILRLGTLVCTTMAPLSLMFQVGYDEKVGLKEHRYPWKVRANISDLVASFYSFAVARSKAWRSQGAGAGKGWASGRVGAYQGPEP